MSDVITEDIKPIVGAEQDVPVEPTKKVKKSKTPKEGDSRFWSVVKFIVSSPWLLLCVPGVIGGIWLANNMWIVTNNINKPYALATGPAFAGSILVLWLVIKFFQGIISWCKSAWISFNNARKEDGSAQFFWGVIVVFMIVSVFASGTFFNTLEHNVIPGLGYITALFIDLVAVQSMRARLNAVRMRDKKGANLYLFGVLLCAGASAFANVYTSLADFNQHLTGALPEWMLIAGPWFGLIFPALILLLSMTADYTLDQISTTLDPEQYKAQEAKRTKLLEYQRDALKDRVTLEREVDMYTAQLQGKKEKRVLFLIAWLFPLKPLSMDMVVENVVNRMDGQIENIVEKAIGGQLKNLSEKADFLYHQVTFLESKSQDLYRTLTSHFNDFSQQYDADLNLISSHFSETFSLLDSHKKVIEEMKIDEIKDSFFSQLPTTGELNKVPETDPKIQIKKSKITRKLSVEELSFDQETPIKEEQKERSPKTPSPRITSIRMTSSKLSRNVYTSSEAARAAKCTVPDIEEALTNGDLAMSKSGKILKSSLEKFITERREKSAKKLSSVK